MTAAPCAPTLSSREMPERGRQPLDLHLKRIVSKRIINVTVLVVGEQRRARPPRAARVIHVSCIRYSYLIPFNSRRLSYTKTLHVGVSFSSAPSLCRFRTIDSISINCRGGMSSYNRFSIQMQICVRRVGYLKS